MSYKDSLLLTISAQGPGARAVLDAIRANADALGIRPLSPALHAAIEEVSPSPSPQLLAVPHLLTQAEAGHA